jgi:hypothetical protein
MTDDTGWNDFGAYTGGGRAVAVPTPTVAADGTGQASAEKFMTQ